MVRDIRIAMSESPRLSPDAIGSVARILLAEDDHLPAVMLRLLMLEQLPGVGEVIAASLRSHGFPSLVDVAIAESDELTAVDGIGPIRAKEIRTAARQMIDGADTALRVA